MYIYNHITPIRSRLSLAFPCLFCSIVWKRSNYSWKLSVAEFIIKIIMVEPFHCSELYPTYLSSELHNTPFCIYSPAASTLFVLQLNTWLLCFVWRMLFITIYAFHTAEEAAQCLRPLEDIVSTDNLQIGQEETDPRTPHSPCWSLSVGKTNNNHFSNITIDCNMKICFKHINCP